MTLNELFQKLWDDYSSINKQAHAIHALLEKQGERVINDHIAFRTYDIPKVNIDVIARPFIKFGYQQKKEYQFPEKKFFAFHYEHKDISLPKIFISALKVKEFSPDIQSIIDNLVNQVPVDHTQRDDFVVSGILWKPISYETYKKLQHASEYAAWLSVYGFRANHFTVFFNAFKKIKTLVDINQLLKNHGFKLNTSGGEIKGSPQEYLEQSSTLADPIEVQFADRKALIPGCYYEFARRYLLPNGKLFHGFVAPSADKIFESTDNKQ